MKILIFVFAISMWYEALGQAVCKKTELIVDIKKSDKGIVYIKTYDHLTYNLIDSSKIINGRIRVILNINEPTLIMLSFNYQNSSFMVNCGLNHYEWNTDSTNAKNITKNDLEKLRNLYDSTIANKTREKLIELYAKKTDKNKFLNDSLDSVQKIVMKKHEIKTREFIRKNKNSFYSLFLLTHDFKNWNIDTVRDLYNQLPIYLKKYPSGKLISAYLNTKIS